MTILRRRAVLMGSTAAALGAPAIVKAQNLAQAGDWPKGPIRIIVPFPPGGSTDPVARIIQAKLVDQTGWQVIVDNKPGGASVVGASVAAKSPSCIAAFNTSPAWLRTNTEIMLDGSRKARAALRNTAHGSSTYSRILWQRITSNDSAWNKLANWVASPCFSAILSVTPASRAARFAKSSICSDASSNVT